MSIKEIKLVVCDECSKELTGKMLARRFKKSKVDVCLDCLESAERVNASGEIVTAAAKQKPVQSEEAKQEPTTEETNA